MNSVQNFQNYSFILPTPRTGFLTTTDLHLGDGANVSVGILGGSRLQSGEKIALVKSANPAQGAIAPTSESIRAQQGVSLLYTLDLAKADNKGLCATVDSTEVNPQTTSLSEGALAGMALVNQGSDMIAGPGMNNAVQAARSADQGESFGMAGFGAVSGGQSRYNTGSHVDMSSVSLMLGLSRGLDLSPGYLTLAALFEYGNGAYNTYNSFSDADDVEGDGNMYYLGGGILGRMDFLDTGPGHFYAEASGRIGSAHNEYSSDLQDAIGRKVEYDTDSTYYGLHAGLGYIWKITEEASLDLYGKYFWTRQEGKSVTI